MANPYVSVVILTLGDAPRVMECLKKQTFQDFEVIFAREKGIVHAMNCALKVARGTIFVRVDDDVELPPTWLSELIKPFSDYAIGGATGPTFVPYTRRQNRDSIRIWQSPNRFLRWLQDDRLFAPAAIYKCGMVSYDSNYQERFDLKMDGQIFYSPDHLEGTNWAMKTDLIRKVGGFDPAFGGVAEWFDDDVVFKAKELGYKLAYNPKAFLFHLLDFTGSYNDRFQAWGRIKNWLRFHWRHSKFHPKMAVFLLVWVGYFIKARVKK